MSEILHHYIVLRNDLPSGTKLAMTVHAAGESAVRQIPEGTFAYVLRVDDEAELLRRSERLRAIGCPHIVVREPDVPWNGQAMAIGLVPTTDKERCSKVLGDLPLAR